MESKPLITILEIFGVPLNEEQAWAVCHQTAKYLEQCWTSQPENCFRLSGIPSVEICRDGSVTSHKNVTPNAAAHSEQQLVESLGLVIYQALDYGLAESEEHKLSPALEGLIERMTESEDAAGEEGDERSDDGDEGIENDVEDEDKVNGGGADSGLKLRHIMEISSLHLQNPIEAQCHYKAVCRALYAEAVELSMFLEKMSTERENLMSDDMVDGDDGGLEDLKRADWARLWIQMMRELRQGVKLRKVKERLLHHSFEFELTPYEILMEDIRSHRYSLNKIMINGNIPRRTKKDAHNVMLEFIRSRPPLHSAKNRVLATPSPKTHSPREHMLRAIRSEPRLRPTPGRIIESSRTKLSEDDDTPATSRKVIKPDLFLFNSDDEDELYSDDDDEDEESPFDDKNKVTPSPLSPLTPLSPDTPIFKPPATWKQTERDGISKDKKPKKRCLAPRTVSTDSERRHSITVCETAAESRSKNKKDNSNGDETSPSPINPFAKFNLHQPLFPLGLGNLQTSLECLSLTIEEVMHIRNVLTKAELECLLVDKELHGLLDKGKICFSCKTTKFSLFGNWSTKCRFCQRFVCNKCVSKMNIPTEHFEHIPVYTLSPSPMSPPSDIFIFDPSGSAHTSPGTQRSLSPPARLPSSNISSRERTPDQASAHSPASSHGSGAASSKSGGATSNKSSGSGENSSSLGSIAKWKELARQGATMVINAATTDDSPPNSEHRSRPPLSRARTVTRPPPSRIIQGPTMNICRDCKAMIVGIIRASRSTLATAPSEEKVYSDCPSRKASRNFHLDIKPVYKSTRKK